MELKNTKKMASCLLLAFALSPVFATADDASTLDDRKIAEIMQTANMVEVDAAKLAQSKAVTPQVKEFAEHMVVEHRQNTKDGKDVAKKVKIKPQPNDFAKGLKKDAKTNLADLKKMKGEDFDKAYMKMQISMHQTLLNDLDDKFIPAAKNEQFKQYLQTTRTHVADHLAKAQNVDIDISK